ncbi:MAG: radical SAM protein, partial [Patescibacteria group bacterium]
MKNKRLHELIFFVTSRCNSRCRHCFNWRNIGKVVDLDLIEIEKRAKRLPHFDNLLLSGGEPFLRKDLADLINIFVRNNKIKTVSIPTNGLLTASIIDILEKILLIPNINAVNINFSLDGLNDIHDNIRGIEGNFVITMESIKAVSALREKYPRLN